MSQKLGGAIGDISMIIVIGGITYAITHRAGSPEVIVEQVRKNPPIRTVRRIHRLRRGR